jgi:hypothetical protein
MMSHTINMPTLAALTFPDFAVLDFRLEDAAHRLSIEMEGAWLDHDGGREIGRGKLVIEGWSAMSVSRYDHEAWTEITNVAVEALKDICEVELGPTTTLSGFSTYTGLWTRYIFRNATAHYTLGAEDALDDS